MSAFDVVRDISALEAAERAGLALQTRGARSWARCPASGERTASLCIYPDGGWHCFSCNAGGDAVALYAHILGLSPIDAARRLAEDFGIHRGSYKAVPQAIKQAQADKELVLRLSDWMRRTWLALCDYRHALLARADTYGGVTAENANLPALREVIEDLPQIDRALDLHYETWGQGVDTIIKYYKVHGKEVERLVRNSERFTNGGRAAHGA